MKPELLLAHVRARLEEEACPANREGIMNYFREPIDPYGVKTPVVRRLARESWQEIRNWPPARRNRFCNNLWKSGRFEEGVLAGEIYRRFSRTCGPGEFKLFESWIDRYVKNWAHCDAVSYYLVSAALDNEPSLGQQIPGWTESRNRWKRRAAAVSLVKDGRRGRNRDLILEIAALLAGDGDDMVRKGVGWLLKETYARHPIETVGFLEPRKDSMPRLVLRIAAEKMTQADRARVLAPARRS